MSIIISPDTCYKLFLVYAYICQLVVLYRTYKDPWILNTRYIISCTYMVASIHFFIYCYIADIKYFNPQYNASDETKYKVFICTNIFSFIGLFTMLYKLYKCPYTIDSLSIVNNWLVCSGICLLYLIILT